MSTKSKLFEVYKKCRIHFNSSGGLGFGKIYPINKINKQTSWAEHHSTGC